MEKIKISAVSYTNSKPFIYGLENSPILNKIDLQKDIPADCAEKLITNQVDIGLVPIATFPLIPNAQIIADYCIGSDGAVNSVFVLANKAISDIRVIQLDAHSRTSNNLTKVLFHHYFKQEIQYLPAGEMNSTIQPDAWVLIGDRTFNVLDQYTTVLDLGQVWKDFTGLPFVYAAWIANKPISEAFCMEFNQALKLGVEHIDQVIPTLTGIEGIDIRDYFYNKLKFDLDSPKLTAINLFLDKINSLPESIKN